MPHGIETGWQLACQPPGTQALADPDILDAALESPHFRHEVLLAPGELVVGNHCIAHARTACSDEPERPCLMLRRWMLRLWLNAP